MIFVIRLSSFASMGSIPPRAGGRQMQAAQLRI